ncbi:MAG: RIP metalloprotease RseP [Parcubacteria bacterium C7867-004]|nr:MAG: RIP metalloprotease RseP [Parcubacteria bacterium C7867-004]
MTIVIFILVLVALIVVHEFGHFVVAKLSGMRVDEFGLGYPPKVWGKKFGETEYTFNWLPFGGFVKIHGEDPEVGVDPDPRAFTAKPRSLQALVLVAGIAMNLFFAFLLLTVVLALGTTRALSPEEVAKAPDAQLAIASVLPDSPAGIAGLVPGDVIVSSTAAGGTYAGPDPTLFMALINEEGADAPLELSVKHGSEVKTVSVTPNKGIIASAPERYALGIGLATIGTVKVPLLEAPWEALLLTWQLTKDTAVALAHFFGSIFTLTADLAQVSGPIGIAGAVGIASSDGLAALLSITALISINLALINLLPIPALDGGRLLFVIIEAITRRPIKPAFANAVNAVGFAFLILLMVVVTAHDIFKIVG